jgi:hypothetical protein
MFGLETVYPRPKQTWRTLLAIPIIMLAAPLVLLLLPLLFLMAWLTRPDDVQRGMSADELAEALRSGFRSLGEDETWESLIDSENDDDTPYAPMMQERQ